MKYRVTFFERVDCYWQEYGEVVYVTLTDAFLEITDALDIGDRVTITPIVEVTKKPRKWKYVRISGEDS
tara:strand:- start:2562 stop:2768 length:207 start_codon:yes stop_codon:yes gene_type:complete